MASIKNNILESYFKPNKLVLTGFLFLISIIITHAQVLNNIKDNYKKWQQDNYHEKIFTHVNKNVFIAGEICWFKVYCVEGYANKTNDFSKVAYVEVLDANHIAHLQAKIKLVGGIGNGSFYLPNNLPTGNYQLRAYTAWMKNFNPDQFFETNISILNPLKHGHSDEKNKLSTIDVQFFPEGGHLVAGLHNKLAFKITGTDGKGLPATGYILNKKNDTIVRFKTLKFGMGSFDFNPIREENYLAEIVTTNLKVSKNLPEIKDAGITMITNETDAGWKVNVEQNGSMSNGALYLLVHNNRLISIAEAATQSGGNAVFFVEKSKLDEGLNYISLFSADGKPLCERLIFKRLNSGMQIEVGLDSLVYSPRKKVNLTILTKNTLNNPVSGNLSLSVYRSDSLHVENGQHIDNYFWLASELKGNIESPEYYFNNTNPESNKALDNLLLTQGWSQFNWDIIQNKGAQPVKYLPEFNGHIITGRILQSSNKKPVPNTLTYLTVPAKNSKLFTSKSDSTGQIQFFTSDIYGPGEIFVQSNSQQDSTLRLEIASPFSDQYTTNVIAPLVVGNYAISNLSEHYTDMQVENIFNNKEFKKFYVPNTDTLPFFQSPGKSYVLDNYTRFTTMEEVLREYVSSIVITKHLGNFNIKVFNGEKLLPGKPMLLLDGLPVFDENKIFAMDPLKVKKLDAVTANYLFGPAVFNGILSFSTYKGDLEGLEIDPRTLILDYEGLQLERKFYSPVYDTETRLKSPMPDFRNTLYWNPQVNTNFTSRVELSFFTCDKPGTYTGIVQGISTSGEAGYKVFQFEIRK